MRLSTEINRVNGRSSHMRGRRMEGRNSRIQNHMGDFTGSKGKKSTAQRTHGVRSVRLSGPTHTYLLNLKLPMSSAQHQHTSALRQLKVPRSAPLRL